MLRPCLGRGGAQPFPQDGTAQRRGAATVKSTVFTHGESGWPCFRIPGTLALPNNTLLSFAAARSYTGDHCYPLNATYPKKYSAHVVKRSTDGGVSWGPLTEIARTGIGKHLLPGHSGLHPSHVGYDTDSPEGSEIYSRVHEVALSIFRVDNVSNTTTQSRLWQSESRDFGGSWSQPHPFVISNLHPDNVTAATHIAPGNGIELQEGPRAGRLLAVLIHATQDVVVYSDDAGRSWQMSETPLPQSGEAQLAEVQTSHHAALKQHAIMFDGRTSSATQRGVAWSYDYGVTFTDSHFAHDLTAGTSCMASILSLDQSTPGAGGVERSRRNTSTPLIFSHPSGVNHTHKSKRNAGVLLRSDDGAKTWQKIASATPENASVAFGYSNLNRLADSGRVGLTYETTDAGCDEKADACKIVYRTFEL